MDEVEGVGDAREVGERPAEGVPGGGAEVDGDEQVPAAAALPGLALELRRGVGDDRDEARQQMVQLFAAEGVSLDGDLIPSTDPPAGLTLTRDP